MPEINKIILIIAHTLLWKISIGQITITDLEQIKVNIEISDRPKPYDSSEKFISLQNFNTHEEKMNFGNFKLYKKYIGQQFYLPPISNFTDEQIRYEHPIFYSLSSKTSTHYSQPEVFKPVASHRPFLFLNDTSVLNKYYLAIDILFGSRLDSIYTGDIFLYTDKKSRILFKLVSPENDTVFCTDDEICSRFILVSYFQKTKSLFEGVKLVYDYEYFDGWNMKKTFSIEMTDERYIIKKENDDGSTSIIGKKVLLQPGSKWLCKTVTLLKPEYIISYILENDKGEQIIIRDHSCPDNMGLIQSGFLKVDDYTKKIYLKRLNEQQRIALLKQNEIKRLSEEKLLNERFKLKMKQKYGIEYGNLITLHKVKLGMNMEMCLDSWGAPYNKTKQTDSYGSIEIWEYGFVTSLQFFEGKLVKIIESN